MPAWQPVGQYAEWYWEHLGTNDDGGVTQAFHNVSTRNHTAAHPHPQLASLPFGQFADSHCSRAAVGCAQSTYGPNFRYQDFAPMFKAELFNATEWAELFRRSGARYTVPTSKHHEGFTIWPSAQSWNWNAVDIGPHRDLLGEIMEATRKAGLHAGMYFSLYEWFHPFMSNITKYVDEVMYPQWMDLIDNYKPDVLWLDGDWVANSTVWRTPELVAYAFNDGPTADTIVVDDRLGTDTGRTHGSFFTPEYDATVYDNHKWEASMGTHTTNTA